MDTATLLLNLFQRCDGANPNIQDRRNATTQLTEIRKRADFLPSVLQIYYAADNDNLKLLAVLELKNNVKHFFKSLLSARIVAAKMAQTAELTHEQREVLKSIIQAWIQDDTKRNIHLVQCMATIIGLQIRSKCEPDQILEITYKSLKTQNLILKGLYLCAQVFESIKTFFWCLNLRKHKTLINKLIEIWRALVDIQSMALAEAPKNPDTSIEVLKNCSICFVKIWAVKKYEVQGSEIFDEVCKNTHNYLTIYGFNVKMLSPKTREQFEASLEPLCKLLAETVRKVGDSFTPYRKQYINICLKFIQDPTNPYGMTKFAFLTLGTLLRYAGVTTGEKAYHVVAPGGVHVTIDKDQNEIPIPLGDEVIVERTEGNRVLISHHRTGIRGWMELKNEMDGSPNLKQIKKVEKPISKNEAAEIMGLILNKYLSNITQDWSADAEEFFQDTLNELRLHRGAHTFLGSLIGEFRSHLVPILVQALGEVVLKDPSMIENALQLDVLYNTLGIFISSRCLKKPLEGLDMVTFLQCLARDLGSNYPFLIRRVIWVLGKMKYMIVYGKHHSDVLKMLTKNLGHNDLVIKMTSVKSICDICFMLPAKSYKEHAGIVFPQIIELFGSVEDVRSIAFVVDSARKFMKKIMPELNPEDKKEVLKLATQMWPQYTQSMVRVAMINLITQIASAMRASVHAHEPFFNEILDFCTEFDVEKTSWAWESGLDLWHTFLYNSKAMSDNVCNRFERWIYCMDNLVFTDESIEWIKKGMRIFHSYMLLDKNLILKHHARVDEVIAKCLDSCEKNVDIHYIRVELNYLISIIPQEAPQALKKTLQVALLKILDINIPVETCRYYISIYCQLFLFNFDGAKNLFLDTENAKRLLLPFLRRWADVLPKLLGGSNGRVDYRVSCLMLARMIAVINDDVLNRSLMKAFSSIQDRHILPFKTFSPPPVPNWSKGTELDRACLLFSLKKGSSVQVVPAVKDALHILRNRLGMTGSSI